jgi:hypothetical protein
VIKETKIRNRQKRRWTMLSPLPTPSQPMPSQELMARLQATPSQPLMLNQWTVPSRQLMVQTMLQPPTKPTKRRKILRRRRLLMALRLPLPRQKRRRRSSMAPLPTTNLPCRRLPMVTMMRSRRVKMLEKTLRRPGARPT